MQKRSGRDHPQAGNGRMSKHQISIDYDPKGDMLSVIFGAKGRKGKGYELNDYIYITSVRHNIAT